MILNSKLIILDTEHDGKFENKFYIYIKEIGFKGYLFVSINEKILGFYHREKIRFNRVWLLVG
jgi:hypothetical protein